MWNMWKSFLVSNCTYIIVHTEAQTLQVKEQEGKHISDWRETSPNINVSQGSLHHKSEVIYMKS